MAAIWWPPVGKCYESIEPDLTEWLEAQPVFFVATAPRADEGLLNCSPKGGDTFRVLSGREVAYADLTGSGIETVAHLQENGRIVVMFCAFSGRPRIVRLHGRGSVLYSDDPGFTALAERFPPLEGLRSIIRVHVDRISDSCGFAVPKMKFEGRRDVLDKWCASKTPDELEDYRQKKNAESIDGLPGYRSA